MANEATAQESPSVEVDAHGNPVPGATATEVAAHAGDHGGHGKKTSEVDLTMIALTWVTFGLLAAVLYKVAWKPILAGLQKREEDIRKALDDAQKARDELAKVEANRQRMIDEADAKAREILEAARRGATEAAAAIEAKARDSAQVLLANAKREIEAEQARATAALRKESAELAIQIARRVMAENLDEARSRALVDRLIHNV